MLIKKMIKLQDIVANKNSVKKKMRVARGNGSGKGGTSGRGHKGQKSRSGFSLRAGFEGGQMPLYRRMPKQYRQKKVSNKKNYQLITLSQLNKLEEVDTTVDKAILVENKIIRETSLPLKLLANGTLDKKVNIKVEKVTKNARIQIEKLGGKVEVLG